MSAQVGADVASLCSKCGDVWHVVVAKVGDQIAKVECKECHGVHRYRDPEGKKKAATKKKSTTTRKTAAKKAEAERPVIEPNMDKPVRDYRITEVFEGGDRVSHVKFGLGVAQHSPGPGKIEIMFDDGPKLLAMAKPDLQLERAPRVDRRAATETDG